MFATLQYNRRRSRFGLATLARLASTLSFVGTGISVPFGVCCVGCFCSSLMI